MSYLLSIEGVLRSGNIPDMTGIAIYKALTEYGRVVLLGSPAGREKDEWFLANEELTTHADYVEYLEASAPVHVDRVMRQILWSNSRGPATLVVDSDPRVIARCHDSSISGLLYLSPKFTNPAFRPDYSSKATPWEEMLKTIDYQQELKAKHNPLPAMEEVFVE